MGEVKSVSSRAQRGTFPLLEERSPATLGMTNPGMPRRASRLRPLKDRAVLIVWSGLCTSTVGEDLFRVASVWLAVEVAGNMAGLVTGVQYVAMLIAGLFGGVLFDRWRPVQAMLVLTLVERRLLPACRWSASTSPASRSPC